MRREGKLATQKKVYLDGRVQSADGTIIPVGLHGVLLPIAELLPRVMMQIMKVGHSRARPPFRSLPRADLLEWYYILLKQEQRAARHRKRHYNIVIELNLPADAEAAPNKDLVVVLEELWLLGTTFRLCHLKNKSSFACCDETSSLLSTPAWCETVPWCNRWA